MPDIDDMIVRRIRTGVVVALFLIITGWVYFGNTVNGLYAGLVFVVAALGLHFWASSAFPVATRRVRHVLILVLIVSVGLYAYWGERYNGWETAAVFALLFLAFLAWTGLEHNKRARHVRIGLMLPMVAGIIAYVHLSEEYSKLVEIMATALLLVALPIWGALEVMFYAVTRKVKRPLPSQMKHLKPIKLSPWAQKCFDKHLPLLEEEVPYAEYRKDWMDLLLNEDPDEVKTSVVEPTLALLAALFISWGVSWIGTPVLTLGVFVLLVIPPVIWWALRWSSWYFWRLVFTDMNARLINKPPRPSGLSGGYVIPMELAEFHPPEWQNSRHQSRGWRANIAAKLHIGWVSGDTIVGNDKKWHWLGHFFDPEYVRATFAILRKHALDDKIRA